MSLPALARVDRILLSILLLGALLTAVLHWLLAAPEKTGGLLPVPSTFYNVGSGAKAAYDVLDQLRYPVARLRRRISSQTLQGVGVLFILRPNTGLAREEVAALKDWIEEGHALVVAPGSASESLTMPEKGMHDDTFLDDWFDFKEPPSGSKKKTDGFPVVEREALPQKVKSRDSLMAGLGEVDLPDGRRFDPQSPCQGDLKDATARVFWKDQQGTIGLQVECGDGAIIALADEYPLTNLGIGQGDNGLVLANIVREMSTRYPGKVAFDEFHLGFPEQDFSPVAIVKLMLAGPWRGAAIQAALVGVLALLARAVRFGSPQDVVRKPRRQHREFAEAAGRLFDEAGAASLAAETLYGYYRERICRVLLFERTVEDRQLCEAVQRRAGPDVAAELRQAQEALHGPLSRQNCWPFPRNFIVSRRHSIMELEAVARKAEAMRRELCKVIVGMDSVLDQTVVALLAGGHILLEGPPGTAKTLLVRALAIAIRGEFHRIQFTPDLMPADIIGVNIFNPKSLAFQFSAGPVFCDLLLADEINRAPAKTQSALLEAMQEGQVSVDREVHRLSPVFLTFATQNPIEYEGTYPLPEAQLDRFLFKIVAGYPQKPQEIEILNRYQGGFDAARSSTFGIEPCTSVEELAEIRTAVRQVTAAPQLLDYIVSIIRGTRELPALTLGASPRAAVMLLHGSKALAVLRGRPYVTPDDVRDLAAPVLRHRIVLNPEAEIEGMTADQCVARVLERVEVPRI